MRIGLYGHAVDPDYGAIDDFLSILGDDVTLVLATRGVVERYVSARYPRIVYLRFGLEPERRQALLDLVDGVVIFGRITAIESAAVARGIPVRVVPRRTAKKEA